MLLERAGDFFQLPLGLTERFVFDFVAQRRLAVDSLQIVSGLSGDRFYSQHAANSGHKQVNKVRRPTIKVSAQRIRDGMSSAFDEAKSWIRSIRRTSLLLGRRHQSSSIQALRPSPLAASSVRTEGWRVLGGRSFYELNVLSHLREVISVRRLGLVTCGRSWKRLARSAREHTNGRFSERLGHRQSRPTGHAVFLAVNPTFKAVLRDLLGK